MAKNTVSRIDRNLARRLREARREAGLSTRAVAARLPPRHAVSHATLANYEKGTGVPPVDVLGALADLYRRPLNWFLENRIALEAFRYRNLASRVPLTELRIFEANAGKWAEAFLSLARHLGSELGKAPAVELGRRPGECAQAIRTNILQLDDTQPVQNVVTVLESLSAWAMELKATFEVDAAAASLGEDSVVLFNPLISNERLRMNAAMEVAILLAHSCGAPCDDRFAYPFACSLLLPESQLREAFVGKSFLKLIQYKERFGISLAAMIFMAEAAGVINSSTARWLRAEMIRKGWRQREPGHVWKDRAVTFEMMLEVAIQSKVLSWTEAERVTGIRIDELQERLNSVIDCPDQVPDQEGGPATIRFST